MTRPRTQERAASIGLFVVAVVLGLSLLFVSWTSWRTAHQAQRMLTVGQVAQVVEALRIQSGGQAVGQEQVDGAFEALSRHGLRWMGVVDGDQVVWQAGEPAAADYTPISPGQPVPHGPTLRVVVGAGEASSPAAGGRPPLWGVGPGPVLDAPDIAFLGPGRQLVIDVQPRLAADVWFAARRSLVVGAMMAVLLVVVAGLLLRLSRRAERAEAALADQRRLAALGGMSALMAHEIRNPLAALKGHAQLVEELLPGDSPARHSATRVVGSAKRLERIVEDLLTFARTGDVVAVQARPEDVVREAANGIDGVRVDASAAPGAWAIDPAQLTLVLRNLLLNAAEASPQGGVDAVVSTLEGQLCIDVLDRGPGVGEEPERWFEPFVTSKTRGVGLGLAVCRRVVQLHGGEITASNRPDGGARFRVLIPRA